MKDEQQERQDVNPMRFVIIIGMSIIFTGGLMAYTVQANLDLLTLVSPNPQFVAFAMLALEGGVIYWIGYYMLHWNYTFKGIAVLMIVIDLGASLVGFFIDTNLHAQSHGVGLQLQDWFPSVELLVGFDVALNVIVGVLVHMLPHNVRVKRQDFQPLLDGASHAANRVSEVAQNGATKTKELAGSSIEAIRKNIPRPPEAK